MIKIYTSPHSSCTAMKANQSVQAISMTEYREIDASYTKSRLEIISVCRDTGIAGMAQNQTRVHIILYR